MDPELIIDNALSNTPSPDRSEQTVSARKSKRLPMTSESPVVIRSELLPKSWPKYVRTSVPVKCSPGLGAWLVREMVANTYRPAYYPKLVQANWDQLVDAERYACAASMWTKAVSVLQYHGTGAGSSAVAERIARRLYGCLPAGYQLDPAPKSRFPTCNHELCIYCYARRVVNMFSDLGRAFQRRPPESEIWISPIYLIDQPKKFQARLRKLRPAGAAVFYHPIGTTLTEKQDWLIRGVMMTDDGSKFEGRKYKRRIYNSSQLAKALSVWMRYPVGWYRRGIVPTLRSMVHLFSQLPPNVNRYAALGACRAEWIPGKFWLDFVGYDHGVPPEIAARYPDISGETT